MTAVGGFALNASTIQGALGARWRRGSSLRSALMSRSYRGPLRSASAASPEDANPFVERRRDLLQRGDHAVVLADRRIALVGTPVFVVDDLRQAREMRLAGRHERAH